MGDRIPHDLRSLSSALDTADGLAVIDTDRRVVAWNGAAEQITGRSAQDVQGRICCEVFGGRDPNGNRICFPGCPVLTMAEQNEGPAHIDVLVEHADGRALWLDMSTLIIRNDGSGVRGLVHVFRDVTERRLLEAHLKRTLGERWQRSQSGAARIASLTTREREVLRLFASGLSTQTIARRLNISRATVRNHSQNILGKLEVHSMRAAIAATYRFFPPSGGDALPPEEGVSEDGEDEGSECAAEEDRSEN